VYGALTNAKQKRSKPQMKKKKVKKSLGKKGLPSEGKLVEEGTAKVFFQGDVFYNPVQVFNRDLSIHVIKAFDVLRKEELKTGKSKIRRATQRGIKVENLRILEALSATGLRSIRYVKEIPNVAKCVANDISKEAAEAIHRNAVSNECDTSVLQASHNDAVLLMHQHKTPSKQFHVVDLDPYGAPTMFLDSGVQSVSEGGLMCVTCTDMPVLSGVYPETCYAKYNSIPVKGKYCHEMALRILLHSISTHASRYGRYIKPLLSVSTDFYIRVFVRVWTSKLQVKMNPTKQSYVRVLTCSLDSLDNAPSTCSLTQSLTQ
jgi:tRNA (guanine26-N2/guanine27-N2)-dimethyltransferase